MRIEKTIRKYYDSEVEKIAVPPMPGRFVNAETRKGFRFFGSEAGGAIAAVCAGVAILFGLIFGKPNPVIVDSFVYLMSDEELHIETRESVLKILQSIEF